MTLTLKLTDDLHQLDGAALETLVEHVHVADAQTVAGKRRWRVRGHLVQREEPRAEERAKL